MYKSVASLIEEKKDRIKELENDIALMREELAGLPVQIEARTAEVGRLRSEIVNLALDGAGPPPFDHRLNVNFRC